MQNVAEKQLMITKCTANIEHLFPQRGKPPSTTAVPFRQAASRTSFSGLPHLIST